MPLTAHLPPSRLSLFIAAFAWLAGISQTNAQSANDLIATFDVSTDVVAGNWTKQDNQLKVGNDKRARCVLSRKVPASYSLTVEFTRTDGTDSIGLILPAGTGQCVLNMSAFNGEAHGIGLINGAPARSNSTTVEPGKLENEHTYRLLVEVESSGDQVSIGSQLDGRPFLSWTGPSRALSMMDFWKLPETSSLGLFTNAETTFHRITVNRLDPAMRMTQAAALKKEQSSRQVEFEGRQWSGPNAEVLEVTNFRGRQALHIKGTEPNFVYLPMSKFDNGVIEVDIASETFSGIGFHGSSDGSVAEKVYFRPFNSGTARHENTVQYSMLGRPQFGWRSLRENFPGRYESGADISVNEWFHVRVEIDRPRLTVFVNDSEDPALIVDNFPNRLPSGTLGVWGWDSYFSEFSFTPAK